ncbi:MAG: MBL fold metallo-hydrolase [Syntrophobacteraceae bacterium]
MRVKFIGVGEAFDEELPNTSILVGTGEGADENFILFDCGFTAPSSFWKNCPEPDRLEAIWISHFHGDHFFGLPALLARFRQANRKRPLLLIGQQGTKEIVTQTLGLAYPSLAQKIEYELRFVEVEPGQTLLEAGVFWQFALNGHSRKDLAVRVEKGSKSVFYSGDGMPTEETVSLARGADLAIHEAFRIDGEPPGHATVLRAIEFARRAKVRRLALVHVDRDERKLRRGDILRMVGAVPDLEIFLPEPGAEWRI